MRLGQLARKLELRPAQVIDFLASKNIRIEEDVNTKVDDGYVTLVFQQFAPGEEVENIPDADTPSAGTRDPIVEVTVPHENVEPSVTADTEVLERSEVIKATKVELSGLKVLGKID